MDDRSQVPRRKPTPHSLAWSARQPSLPDFLPHTVYPVPLPPAYIYAMKTQDPFVHHTHMTFPAYPSYVYDATPVPTVLYHLPPPRLPMPFHHLPDMSTNPTLPSTERFHPPCRCHILAKPPPLMLDAGVQATSKIRDPAAISPSIGSSGSSIVNQTVYKIRPRSNPLKAFRNVGPRGLEPTNTQKLQKKKRLKKRRNPGASDLSLVSRRLRQYWANPSLSPTHPFVSLRHLLYEDLGDWEVFTQHDLSHIRVSPNLIPFERPPLRKKYHHQLN